jgi:hypothetical protein
MVAKPEGLTVMFPTGVGVTAKVDERPVLGAIGRVMTATSKRRIAYLCRGPRAHDPGDNARSRE